MFKLYLSCNLSDQSTKYLSVIWSVKYFIIMNTMIRRRSDIFCSSVQEPFSVAFISYCCYKNLFFFVRPIQMFSHFFSIIYTFIEQCVLRLYTFSLSSGSVFIESNAPNSLHYNCISASLLMTCHSLHSQSLMLFKEIQSSSLKVIC